MKTILVTGAAGQLGKCLQKISDDFPEMDFLFLTSEEFDITSRCNVHNVFSNKRIDVCVNCAAFTNVEGAESEKEKAFSINSEGVKILAEYCDEHGAKLIHISTDYVFDGKSKEMYSEKSATNPINVYGASKLKGEKYIAKFCREYFIIRTSWLYCEFGHNFFKTILKKADEGANLNITTAQTGTPTNANDLAQFIMFLICKDSDAYGIYNFSNEGSTTWFHFAEEILKQQGNRDKINLKEDNSYKTVAKRPENSVLSKDKIRSTFNFPIENWKSSLENLCKVSLEK